MVREALLAAGFAHQVQRAGNLFSVFFTESPVANFAGAQSQDTGAFSRFFHSLLSDGVSIPPSAFEAWFVSAAHTDSDLEKLQAALPAAAQAASSRSTGTTKEA
jgi:glutamate-1-semialdehyde 2,1-aminomutase